MTVNQQAYLNYQETQRANLARESETERSNRAYEAETHRSNVAREAETNRSNVARETETNRSNLANEGFTAQRVAEEQRHNQVTESQQDRALKQQRTKDIISGLGKVADIIAIPFGGAGVGTAVTKALVGMPWDNL